MHFQSGIQEEKWDSLLMLSVLGIYPFLPSHLAVGSVTLQSLFLFVILLSVLALHFLEKKAYRWQLPCMRNLMGIVVVLTAFGVGASMLQKMFRDNDLGRISFEGEVFLLVFIGMFILTASGRKFDSRYFDTIIYAGLLISGALLYYELCGMEQGGIMQMIVQSDAETASYMLLIGTTSVLQYCGCREQYRSLFYAGSALISFFLLFLTQNRAGIGIMGLVFVTIPILFRPTVELVKRDMQLFFCYLLLLSNMGLIVGYTDIVQKELSYSLQGGVYLELAMAAGGAVFFHYWERIPEGMDTERLVLRRMRKGYQLLFRGLLLFMAAAVIGDIEGRFGNGAGGFGYLYARTGICGVLLLVFVLAVSVGKLKRNYHPDKPVTVKLAVLSGIFMAQLFFLEPAPQSCPIYVWLMLCALYSKEERKRVRSTKINVTPEDSDFHVKGE